jgi:hypothetical protein
MNIYKVLEKERKHNLGKIYLPFAIMAGAGYFLYALIAENFFVGWEMYFAIGCYILIVITLLVIDSKILWMMHYDIYIMDEKLRIKDGFFSRVISIPLERLYYVSTVKYGRGYDSIFVTDKKITHSKVKMLSENEFKGTEGHLGVISELKDRYPCKTFYYYRVYHHGYKFLYFFYMVYKACDRCKFSNTSMELVKNCVNLG